MAELVFGFPTSFKVVITISSEFTHSYADYKDSQPCSSTPTPSQWPGCGYWRRQIAIRDETYARNPITRARFLKHVATSVDKFFDVSFLSLLPSSPPLIRSSFPSPLAMPEGRLWWRPQLANRCTQYYAKTREDYWCHPCVCWELDAHHTINRICVPQPRGFALCHLVRHSSHRLGALYRILVDYRGTVGGAQ